jgi:hypothetical protein
MIDMKTVLHGIEVKPEHKQSPLEEHFGNDIELK